MNRVLLAALLFAILFSALTCITENIGGTVIYEGYIIYGATYHYPDMDIVTYNGTTVNNTLYLKPGDIVVPHLYNWYFDGQDDYIVGTYALDLKTITILEWVKHLEYEGENWVFRWAGGYRQFGYPYWGSVDKVRMIFNCETTDGWKSIVSAYHSADLGTWHQAGVIFDSDTKYLGFVLDGKTFQETTLPYTLTERSGTWTINQGVGGIKDLQGFIASVLVYNRVLSGSEIERNYNDRVVNAGGLVLFLDPTFYNGTHYLDLSGYGNHGVPYGVERVEADKKWLWVVRNYTGQPYILLKSFNENSSWIIDGELYSDGAQFIGEGWHEVKLYYPVNATGVAIIGLPDNAIVAIYDLDADKAYFGLSSNGTALIRIPYSIKHARIVLYTSSEQDYEKPWYNDPGSIVTIVLISTVLGYFVIKIIRYIEEHF